MSDTPLYPWLNYSHVCIHAILFYSPFVLCVLYNHHCALVIPPFVMRTIRWPVLNDVHPWYLRTIAAASYLAMSAEIIYTCACTTWPSLCASYSSLCYARHVLVYAQRRPYILLHPLYLCTHAVESYVDDHHSDHSYICTFWHMYTSCTHCKNQFWLSLARIIA